MTNKKKETKVQNTFRLFNKYTKGKDAMKSADAVKQLTKELKISERLVRSYLWRARNPEKFKACVDRYFEKKRKAKEAEKAGEKSKDSKSKKEKFHIEAETVVKPLETTEPIEEVENNL